MYIQPPNPNRSALLAQEQEMNDTLQEALNCTSCHLRLTKATMHRDIKTGVYEATRDPPFIHSHSRPYTALHNPDSDCSTGTGTGCDYPEEEEVGPLDEPRPKPIPKYSSFITPLQRATYEECVADMLELQASRLRPGKTANEDEETSFAYYQVDYHIHLHGRARCDMLTMCRDIEDVRQMRGWKVEMTNMNQDWDDKREDELFTVHQTNLWRRRYRLRRKRLAEVRKKWANIMEERRRQREELLRKRAMERQKVQQARVRLYCSREGDRMLLGEFNI